MKKKILVILGVLILMFGGFITYILVSLRPVSKVANDVTFTVKPGTNKIAIVSNLKKAGLIRSKVAGLVYVFFSPKINLQAGNYSINRSKSTSEILKQIADGKIIEVIPTVRVTFIEGKKLTDYAKLVSNNFDISYDDFIAKAADKEFLNTLIKDYSFLDESILNPNIYYPLEGYLAPDTYEFYQNSSSETIIRKLLDRTGEILENYQEQIKNSKYSVHQLLTIASIAEKEAVNAKDRQTVSQVIYKRLDLNMALGMDVTTYYSVFKEMTEDITAADLASKNAYNTRNSEFKGLPASAICNPSKESINAALNPSKTDYVYFVADVDTGKVYFASTYEEFTSFKAKLGL